MSWPIATTYLAFYIIVYDPDLWPWDVLLHLLECKTSYYPTNGISVLSSESLLTGLVSSRNLAYIIRQSLPYKPGPTMARGQCLPGALCHYIVPYWEQYDIRSCVLTLCEAPPLPPWSVCNWYLVITYLYYIRLLFISSFIYWVCYEYKLYT